MIYENDLELGDDYWFVFIPHVSINSQNVKIEKIFLDLINDNNFVFRVYRYDDKKEEEFLTLDLTIKKSENKTYENIFKFDKKEEAEMFWAKEFFKKFKQVNGFEFEKFVSLYKKVQEEYPEWIL